MGAIEIELVESTSKPINTPLSIARKAENELIDKHDLLNLPVRFRTKTLENFFGYKDEVAESLKAVLDGKSLLITGLCGRGKTHLAVGLMREWFLNGIVCGEVCGEIEKHYPNVPVFLTCIELMLELKRTFDSRESSELEVIDSYAGKDLVLIDDLGAEKISEWSITAFYALLDKRYRNMKQTIITTNLTLQEINTKLDDRIASRLVEMGKIVKLSGEDFRLKKTI